MMNYSENTTTHGRKMVTSSSGRSGSRRKKDYTLVIILICTLLAGFALGFLTGEIITSDIEPFGTIQQDITTGELTYNWESGTADEFIPLDVKMDYKTQEQIYFMSKAYNLDFAFVMGVISKESSFQADVVTGNNYGLMQINKVNHEWLENQLGLINILDPLQNAKAGMFILKNLFEKYEQPGKVLMAYNLGEYGAKKLWNQGINESYYSKDVMEKAFAFTIQIKERSTNND